MRKPSLARLSIGAAAALALAFVSACDHDDDSDKHKDVSQDNVQAAYKVTYDADKGVQHSMAQFRTGGDTGAPVKLADPAKIELEGTAMTLHDEPSLQFAVVGTHYEADQTVATPAPKVTFVWTRGDGKVMKDDATMPPAISVTAPAASAQPKLSAELDVTTQTDDPAGADKVVVTMMNSKAVVTAALVSPNHYAFAPADLAKIGAGTAVIYASRARSVPSSTAANKVGGIVQTEYDAKTVQVQLVQ